MSDLLLIVISVAVSVPAVVTVLAVGVWILWARLPSVRARLQRQVFSAGATESKLKELQRRISAAERAQLRVERALEKEIESGKKAERAMTDILQGVTRSALRADERLSAIERREDSHVRND